MNQPLLCRILFLHLFILSFRIASAQAPEPEALKERYEGNHRVPSAFRNAAVPATSADELNAAIAKRQTLLQQSVLKNYPVRNIGPTVMSGRIVDVAVNEQNPKIFYVGYASGGVYKTINNGNTLEPVFDHQRVLGIGDLTLAPSNPDILWVGTGENNSSRSSYAGAGVYKTTDAGKTWQFMGLDFTQHIGRIAIHPQNPDVVWVAAIGALYSTSKDRGLYKTSDGGKTWKKTLFVDDSTGVIDVVVNPQNPSQLWTASWQRQRNAGNFVGNGNGTAIWISNDGGETWQKSMTGFPQGAFVGRIGLDICRSQPNVLYAILDNQETVKKEKTEKKKDEPKLKKEAFKTMTVEAMMALSNSELDTFLIKSGFPKKYTAQVVKEEIRKGKYTPKALFDYFGDANDANENLFTTTIKGAELYRSEDGGKTWKKVNEKSLDGLFYTYGYYFAQVRVSPVNPDKVFLFGVPMIVSRDGGKNFTLTDTLGRVHGDHHAMWINPKDDDHLLNGNDGGLNISYDGGYSWSHANMPSVGQFYSVMVDMEKPYNVYGGLQDNGTYVGSSRSVPGKTADWEAIGGGDGMMVAVDPRNSSVRYTGFQYGNYFKNDKGRSRYITPKHDIGEAPLRWNWRSPLILSPHNPDIVYLGSQRLHRSLDGAQTWQAISPDLTKNKKQGNVPYSTLTVIAESPLKFGLIYAGTDDGNIQLTRDGGATWQLISGSLPQDLWVSSLLPSKFDEATVYATLNGYRYDNFKSYVYKSTDYGKTWTSLSANLPDECANVIVQDPVNQNLLYLGSDHGTYLSLDEGKQWQLLANLPNVANYDMIVHPRDNELVIGTHGRSVYVMDVKPLQNLKDGKQSQALVAFAPVTVQAGGDDEDDSYSFVPQTELLANTMYYVGKTSPSVTAEILEASGKVIRKLTGSGEAGFQFIRWDLKGETATPKSKAKTTTLTPVKPGEYKVKLSSGTATAETKVIVK
jgi:photosystem II stability/assembly factor-like uncharacterized protein